jgi:hypothetical protein
LRSGLKISLNDGSAESIRKSFQELAATNFQKQNDYGRSEEREGKKRGVLMHRIFADFASFVVTPSGPIISARWYEVTFGHRFADAELWESFK